MFFAEALLVALSAVSMASAATLHISSGCIFVDGKAACNNSNRLDVNGDVEILCDIRKESDGTSAYRRLLVEIPQQRTDVYFAENCLYGTKDHSIPLGCASALARKKVSDVYG
ncbi:hypothetical protein BDV95DRAFT_567780 [Massariosphaeria phaeospora]|uniref:Uncharacterized protein n=1 Tax=Massariosphaeria phaeospora TaxID=100035 RepID=A0A7C8MBP1_9PLEO|nr:hypothetical protein BDV95DRAFT_567780 [Massariosphaeria phaeospora]